jgi:hypothetical protein
MPHGLFAIWPHGLFAIWGREAKCSGSARFAPESRASTGQNPSLLLFLINKTQKLGKSEEILPQNDNFSRFYSADIESEREIG